MQCRYYRPIDLVSANIIYTHPHMTFDDRSDYYNCSMNIEV